ncbi:MAG: MarR family transcriptional regulator [Burkholderiaceae bacterium]
MPAGQVDLETRVTDADHTALRLWLRLLTCTNLIEADVRRRLRARFASTLPRFDLLAQLERSHEGLRMSELSRRLMVTGGNITGLTEQLVAEGWLTRDPDPADRRATRVRLTRHGRQRFAAMAGEHERWVRDLLAPLSRDEQKTLLALLGKLKAGIGP